MDPIQRYTTYVRHTSAPTVAGSVFMRRTRLLLGHSVCLFCILLLFFYLFCIILVIPYTIHTDLLFSTFFHNILLYFYWAFLSLLCIIFGHVCTLFCLFYIIFCHVCDLLVWSLFLLFLSSPWTTLHQTRFLSSPWTTFSPDACVVHTVCRLASIITLLLFLCPLCLPINLFLQPTFSLGLYYFVVLY